MALVVDECGDIDGLVSLTDVMSAIVGELPGEPGEEPTVIRREDRSWLIDGMLDLDGVKRAIDLKALAGEEEASYHTLGGLAMRALGRVPRTGDVFRTTGISIRGRAHGPGTGLTASWSAGVLPPPAG